MDVFCLWAASPPKDKKHPLPFRTRFARAKGDKKSAMHWHGASNNPTLIHHCIILFLYILCAISAAMVHGIFLGSLCCQAMFAIGLYGCLSCFLMIALLMVLGGCMMMFCGCLMVLGRLFVIFDVLLIFNSAGGRWSDRRSALGLELFGSGTRTHWGLFFDRCYNFIHFVIIFIVDEFPQRCKGAGFSRIHCYVTLDFICMIHAA